MRVTCEKCSAPYAVDDRLIPPQGVRAQCPKCRHLQVVRRAAEPAAAAPALAPPAPPPSRGPQFGGAAASPPLASPPPPVDSGPVVKCRSCAVALPDPLDAALGICESCRSKEVAPTPTAPAGEDAFRREVVTRAPPAAPTREEPEGGSSGLELDTGARPAPKPAPRPPAPAAPRSNKPIMAPPRMTRSRGPSAGVIAGAGLGLVLLGGAGAWFALGRPALPFAEQKPPAPAIHPAIEKRLAGWRAAAREMEGTAAEHFERGLKLYAEDKAPSYLAAEEAFRTALILDPADMKAAAWLVASFAVGRGPQASEAELADMRELLGAVKEASPRSALASIARANLLLAANEAELARAEAESAFAIASDAEKAEALVAWGRTYLRKSAPVAREKFEQALQLDPSLKRAIYLRGLAAENAGRYAQALSDYEQRLALDPAQRDALRAVARVHASLGDFKKAREALARYAQQHPNVGEPRILLVQIAYAVERDLRDADARLKRLNLDYDRFSDAEKVQLLTLWTAVAREKGEIRLADGQARSALRLDPRHAPAHFQLLLLALAGGRADEARQHLESCERELDPARLWEYRGRVDAAAGRPDRAADAFLKAVEQNGARIAPRLNAAALLMKAGERDRAYKVMRDALELDSASVSEQRRPVSDYFEAPVDGIRLAAGLFEADLSGDDALLRQTYGAIVQYHLGNVDGAARKLDAVLDNDPSSLGALLYRAQIELDRRQYDKALRFAQRAAASDTQASASLYLQGRAYEGLKKRDEAWKRYAQVLGLEPNHLGANLRLAQFAAAEGKDDEAKERLTKVVSVEPEHMEARTELFRLGY